MTSEAFYVILIYYFLIGTIVGFLSSTIGLGGSILAILILLFDVDKSLALDFTTFEKSRVIIANTMFTLLATNIAVAMRKGQSLKISKDMFISITLPAVVFTSITSWLIINYNILPLYLFTVIFMGIMVYTTITIFRSRNEAFGSNCRVNGIGNRIKLLLVGGVSGLLPALSAAESSPIVVPFLNERCGLSIQKAVNVFSTVFFYVTICIGLMYLIADPTIEIPFPGPKMGYIVVIKAVPMAVGAFLTAYFGYDLFKKTNLRYVAYITTFILALFTLRVFFMDIIKPLY